MRFEGNSSMDIFPETTVSIQKNEQNRIARHLHDTLGNDLAYLCMKLDQISNTRQIAGTQELHSEIEAMQNIANKAYEQVRNLMSELRDEYQPHSSSDLVSQANECALLIGERARFTVNSQIEGSPITLPPQIQSEILYLVRETLRNIEKHAQAKNVMMIFSWMENGLTITISDDGRGFDTSMGHTENGHHGLKIIQEIVTELNGSLFVESDHAQGTQINLWLPINQLSF